MSMAKYKCKSCGKEITVDEKAGVPECCDVKMKQIPLEMCTSPHDAETYRSQNADDPCDDGVK